MRWLRFFFRHQPFADRTLCHFLQRRLTLPTLSLADLFPDFDKRIVSLGQLPRGSWSTPLADVVILLKIAVCTEPRRLLEIGSYRGYTALFLAQHISPDARIVTIDRNPKHGEAYAKTSFAGMIERRVGATDRAMFAPDGLATYDLIFIDADHSYESVRKDTESVLPLLSPAGFIVWHDYANWGYFSGQNGVPEYLGELAARLPIGHVLGSTLAIHSPSWISGSGSERFRSAMKEKTSELGADPWQGNLPRG
jgi:predicted O-methyltransferase YrrM